MPSSASTASPELTAEEVISEIETPVKRAAVERELAESCKDIKYPTSPISPEYPLLGDPLYGLLLEEAEYIRLLIDRRKYEIKNQPRTIGMHLVKRDSEQMGLDSWDYHLKQTLRELYVANGLAEGLNKASILVEELNKNALAYIDEKMPLQGQAR